MCWQLTLLERLAQALDVDVDRALLDEDMVAPDPVEQLRPAVHALGMGHEEMQQPELGGADLDLATLAGDPAGGRIDRQAADDDRRVQRFGRATPQDGTDPRQQLVGRERLGEVVVGAGIQAGDLVGLLRPGGQHDDRQLTGARLAPPGSGQRVAALSGKHPVEHDQVGRMPSTATWACSASPAMVTSKPAWRRLIEISSAIAGSSSTTRIRLINFFPARLSEPGPRPCPPDRGERPALDDVDDLLGQVLGVIADALDRLGDEHEVDARGDGARILHHVGDELAQQALELLVDVVVLLQHFEGALGIEAGERIERLAQLGDGSSAS